MLTAVITSPPDGDVIAGPDATAVTFAATLAGAVPGGAPLLLRWWSTVPPDPWAVANLSAPVDFDAIAIAPQSPAASLTAPLRVGSQAITLAVKDRPGDGAADLRQVTQAASAGGGPDPYLPAAGPGGVVLPRSFGLWAQAPANWQTDDYKNLNLVSYAWAIAPSGGGPAISLPPAGTDLSFRAAVPSDHPAQRVPPLVGLETVPAQVPAGLAMLTLTVSATVPGGMHGQHQIQVSVTVQD